MATSGELLGRYHRQSNTGSSNVKNQDYRDEEDWRPGNEEKKDIGKVSIHRAQPSETYWICTHAQEPGTI